MGRSGDGRFSLCAQHEREEGVASGRRARTALRALAAGLGLASIAVFLPVLAGKDPTPRVEVVPTGFRPGTISVRLLLDSPRPDLVPFPEGILLLRHRLRNGDIPVRSGTAAVLVEVILRGSDGGGGTGLADIRLPLAPFLLTVPRINAAKVVNVADAVAIRPSGAPLAVRLCAQQMMVEYGFRFCALAKQSIARQGERAASGGGA